MSWQATCFVDDLTEHPDGTKLTAREKLILYVLANAHNRDYDCCWLSVSRACGRALTSRSRFLVLMARLESKGTISIERREGKTNIYRFCGLVLKQDGSDKKAVLKKDPTSPVAATPTSPVAVGPEYISNSQGTEIQPVAGWRPADYVLMAIEESTRTRKSTDEILKFWKDHPNARPII